MRKTRRFNGKVFTLREQPIEKMHPGFVDPFHVKYITEAKRIAKNRRAKGQEVRIVKGKHGFRIYYRE